MRVTVLGSNGTYPTAGRPTSGYLFEYGESSIWVDAGSGTFDQILRRVNPASLTGLIISHIHLDHSVDVMPLYHWLRFSGEASTRLPLVLPAATLERLAAYANPSGEAFEQTFEIIVDPPEATLGEFEIGFGAGVHPVPTLQMRIQAGGAAVAYSADTGPGSDLVKLGRGVDLMIAEATFQGSSKPADHHLTASEAGEAASVAGAHRLMLTHILPDLDPTVSVREASRKFEGEIIVAEPGMEVEV